MFAISILIRLLTFAVATFVRCRLLDFCAVLHYLSATVLLRKCVENAQHSVTKSLLCNYVCAVLTNLH